MKKRIKVYWVLLLTLLYTGSFLLSIGQTQCRFDNIISKTSRLESRELGVISNCLVTAEDAPMTVLVGELSLVEPTLVSFWMESVGDYSVGKLRWGIRVVDTDDTEVADWSKYLKITMQSGADVIDPNADLDLLKDVPLELTMMIMPTHVARNTSHGSARINVLVTWGDEMWGTFQVILPAVNAEDETPAETVPEETLPEDHEDPEKIPSDKEQNPEGGEESGKENENKNEGTGAETNPESGNNGSGENPAPSGETGENAGSDQEQGTPIVSVPVGNGTQPEDTNGNPDTQPNAADGTNPDENPNPEQGNGTGENPNPDQGDGTGENPNPDQGDGTGENPNPDQDNDSGENPDPNQGSDTGENPNPEQGNGAGENPNPDQGNGSGEDPDPDKDDPSGDDSDPDDPADQESEEEKEEYRDPFRLETLTSFDPRGQVPVKLAIPKYATAIQFGRGQPVEEDQENEEQILAAAGEAASEEEALNLRVFPRYTRFSLNNGESYYMLYNNHVLQFDVRDYEGEEIPLLLDFSMTELDSLNDMILLMDVYSYGSLIASRDESLSPNAQKSFRTAVFTDEQVQKLLKPLTATPEETESSQPQTVDIVVQTNDNSILDQDKSLVIAMPINWTEADLTYTVEMLTLSEEQKLIYAPVTLTEEGLSVQYIEEEEKGMHYLIAQIGEKLPHAGTYRINMEWSYDGICFAQKQTTFFINYSAKPETKPGS